MSEKIKMKENTMKGVNFGVIEKLREPEREIPVAQYSVI